jgi:hypothetical protein
MESVLITGGTGLIGKHLAKKLQVKGYKVTLLSRTGNPSTGIPVYRWEPDKNEIDNEALSGADYIIHLAGEGIGDKRWTIKRKQLILESRVKTCQLLFNTVRETGSGIKAFITASGIGYYGTVTSEKIFRESDHPGEDFIAEICRQWEKEADRFEDFGIRTVKIRTGIVLAGEGGAIARMMTPVKTGIGSAIGNGRQYLPWIHIEDLCNIYTRAIEDKTLTGAFNAVAPDHKTNKEFIRTLARVLDKPFFFPDIPAFVLRILYGQMSGILLNGSRISCEKIMASGYSFLFPDLEGALRDLFQ